MIVHLGCGRKKYPGSVGVDITSDSSADVVHDLNKAPWPLEDDQFTKAYCVDVVEHVDNVVLFMEEVHRICRDGATVVIQAPFASSHFTYGDPTHKRAFTSKSFKYFDRQFDDAFFHYSHARFSTLEVAYNKYEEWIWTYRPPLIDRLLVGLANRHKDLYERRFMWIYPVQTIYFRLQVVKAPSDRQASLNE
ncbi:MAG: methyltransferase domain-containing protein [Chloroflexia bacterium]